MSISLIIAGLGAVVAAIGSAVLLARCFRGPRADLIAWSIALIGLLISLGSQALGYLSGFDPVMFRAMELGGQVIAPLALVLGMSEVAASGPAARFCARLYLPALAIVSLVVLTLDQLADVKFSKSWPDPAVHYQAPPDYVLMFAVGPVTALVALIAAGVVIRRSGTPGWNALLPAQLAAGAAALLLAYPALVQLAKFAAGVHLPIHSEFSLCCAAAAGLIFYAGNKVERLNLGRLHGRPARSGQWPVSSARSADEDARAFAGRNDSGGREGFGHRDDLAGRGDLASRDDFGRRDDLAGRDDLARRDASGRRDDFARRDEADRQHSLAGHGDSGHRDDYGDRGDWDNFDRGAAVDQTGDIDRFDQGAGQGVYRGGGVYRPEPVPDVALQSADGRGDDHGWQPGHGGFGGEFATGDYDLGHGEDWAARPAGDGRPRQPEPSRADLFGQIAIYTLLEDRVHEFDQLTERVVEEVRGREPDTLVYIVHAVPSAPMQRILYEVYRDRAAYERHRQQPYVTQFDADRRPYLLATNMIELGLQQAKVSPFPSVAELFGEPGYDTSGFERPDYLRDYGKPRR
jgi:quinol monooxygenase YgiN